MKLHLAPRRVAVLAGALTALLVLGGCAGGTGSSDDGESVYEQFAAMSGDERHEALVEAAQAEGEVVVYSTSSIIESVLAPAFEEEYGIRVTVYRATTTDVRQRLLQEASAGRIQNDVIESKESEIELIAQEGDGELITPYASDIASELPEGSQTPHLTAAYYIATTPIFNTSLVDGDDFPSSYEDFADPEWAGKLAIDLNDVNWYLDLYRYYTEQQGMSDDEFADMMKGIAANSRAVDGHLSNTELLRAGDFGVFLSNFLHYVPKDGSGPISYNPDFEPVTLQLIGAAPMTDAPHPAAALLWIDFYLTEAQQYFDAAGYIPSNPDAVPGYEPRLGEDTELVPDDWERLLESGNDWQAAFDNLLRGSDPVLPE